MVREIDVNLGPAPELGWDPRAARPAGDPAPEGERKWAGQRRQEDGGAKPPAEDPHRLPGHVGEKERGEGSKERLREGAEGPLQDDRGDEGGISVLRGYGKRSHHVGSHGHGKKESRKRSH